jgi:hypothetical protein
VDPGAPLPFVTHQAEACATSGTVVGPTYEHNQVPVEASGRRAVRLERGDWLDVTLTGPASSVLVRASIPDSGSVREVPLALAADGVALAPLALTTAYSWRYGAYPFTKDPADGQPQHFFDEAHALVDELPAGTTLRFAVETDDVVTLDLVDLELVAPPGTSPAQSVSVLDHGADPTGAAPSLAAFEAACAAAHPAGVPVWIPPGRFRLDGHLVLDDVTLLGAGMWHSILRGANVGLYGKWAREGGSANVHLAGFRISGDIRTRVDDDQVNGIGGALSRSTVRDVWIEHTKCGVWVDGPLDDLRLERLRIRNQIADGVNFHGGVTGSVVADTHVRGVGDDGLAMWSHRDENRGNRFVGNTVECIYLANGIALYGGRDGEVRGNLVRDAGLNEGGGIHVGNRFDATPVAGETVVADNRIVRSGNFDRNWQHPVGALWFDARDAPLDAPVRVERLSVEDSPLAAVSFVSGERIARVELRDVTVRNAGAAVIQSHVAGEVAVQDVSASGVAGPAVSVVDGFAIRDEGGNESWLGTSPDAAE